MRSPVSEQTDELLLVFAEARIVQVGNVGDPQPVKGGWQLFVLHGERIALQGMIFPRAPHADRDDENGDDCRNDNTCDHFFLPPHRHFLALLTVIIP